MNIGTNVNMFDEAFWRLGKNPYMKLKEFGFTHVDFGLVHTERPLYTLPKEESDKLLLQQKNLMKEAGIEVGQVHGPWCWPPRESHVEGGVENLMNLMKRGVENAAVIDGKHFVLHPVMPYFINDIGTEYEAKTWDVNFKFMRELTDFAKNYGIIICIENMPMTNFSLGRPCEILKLVEEINDDNFQVCLDTGHVAIYGDMDIKEEVLRLGNHLRALHVHDNCEGPDIHIIPYYGDISWSDFASSLREINYNGVFSYEVSPPSIFPTEIREDLYRTYVKIAKFILNE